MIVTCARSFTDEVGVFADFNAFGIRTFRIDLFKPLSEQDHVDAIFHKIMYAWIKFQQLEINIPLSRRKIRGLLVGWRKHVQCILICCGSMTWVIWMPFWKEAIPTLWRNKQSTPLIWVHCFTFPNTICFQRERAYQIPYTIIVCTTPALPSRHKSSRSDKTRTNDRRSPVSPDRHPLGRKGNPLHLPDRYGSSEILQPQRRDLQSVRHRRCCVYREAILAPQRISLWSSCDLVPLAVGQRWQVHGGPTEAVSCLLQRKRHNTDETKWDHQRRNYFCGTDEWIHGSFLCSRNWKDPQQEIAGYRSHCRCRGSFPGSLYRHQSLSVVYGLPERVGGDGSVYYECNRQMPCLLTTNLVRPIIWQHCVVLPTDPIRDSNYDRYEICRSVHPKAKEKEYPVVEHLLCVCLLWYPLFRNVTEQALTRTRTLRSLSLVDSCSFNYV